MNDQFQKNLKQSINFKVALKKNPDRGNLVYEYNPLFNYRLDLDLFYYLNLFYTKEEIAIKFLEQTEEDIQNEKNTKSEKDYLDWLNELFKDINWYEKGVPKTETPPIFYQRGQITDFVTDELLFDLNHPVNIIPSYSYDNSVDLIINDGKNQPRLINSRFSATERNLYIVNDRNGNNDTNIYDKGTQFDVDTSLYKKITTIPKLDFLGVGYGGNLPIGNYNFYFKYIDDDGNESDFFAESAQVQIFIGSTPMSIHSGFRMENSHKTANFLITNLDSAYLKIKVYYTRATSDIRLNMTVNAYVIDEPYTIKNNSIKIAITGYEAFHEITIEEINEVNLRYSASETQAVCLNILFMAHNYKKQQHYNNLRDLALRFLPQLDISYHYTPLNSTYSGNITNTYYNPKFTYEKTGYWSDIYRFGIVFIYSDYTLSEVYDVRGGNNIQEQNQYTEIPVYEGNDSKQGRKYITYDEANYQIIKDNLDESSDIIQGNVDLENCRGVVKFSDDVLLNQIIGIRFKVHKDVIIELKKLGIVGYFFVRQKRIPTILCQAYTIGIDKESHLPALPIGGTLIDDPVPQGGRIRKHLCEIEGFLNKNTRLLEHNTSQRLYQISNEKVLPQGAICPEYDVNYPYFNTLFTGGEFVIQPYTGHFDKNYVVNGESLDDMSNISLEQNTFKDVKIIGVEDNVKLVAIGENRFAARAGDAEEGFRFSYIGEKAIAEDMTNLARGSYGPYLGIVGYDEIGKIINIRIPHYSEFEMENYFRIRYEDAFPYYAITDKMELPDLEYDFNDNIHTTDIFYRGDCFISNFTHRLNRNFQDPSAPFNDEIIDPKCWKENFKVEDSVIKVEEFDKINLGDLNAIRMGQYLNFVMRTNMNLNIRGLDSSWPGEQALFGHPRTFSPYCYKPTEGAYKTPEALCYNKGFEKSVSEKYYMRLPNVPFLKEDFTNRISYSNIKATNSFLNGHRVFKGTHYRDYSKEYGSIIKLVEWKDNLICVCEHGVLYIGVNEKAIAATAQSGYAYLTTLNVLTETPLAISHRIGSLWRESVIATDNYVYGVDTVARKIWRTNGQTMEYISDNRIQEFLNNNISLTERELTPIIGVRNVKTHYNAFKGDVMFTFYDNLYGFTERVWNICYSEPLQKWITFYSWVPSYSENIYNSMFSFDRNTSKWIAKLGISKEGNAFSDGIVLSENIFKYDGSLKYLIGYLDLQNRSLPQGDGVTNEIEFTLERDNYGNYKYFKIEEVSIDNVPIKLKNKYLDSKGNCTRTKWYALYTRANTQDGTKITYKDLCSELYFRTTNKKNKIYPTDSKYNLNLDIYKNDKGLRVNLPSSENGRDRRKNGDKVVILLNIRANIQTEKEGVNQDLKDVYQGSANIQKQDAGYYQSVVAVIPEYNMQFLSTDFWRHGQAGIIDIADKIYPTYWYGKQHPFEFEFIVAENPDAHKIFDNLKLLSNKAAPHSFHYEIIGECYDFAKDKKNMYIRLEATKELYQYNGIDIEFNKEYKNLENVPRDLKNGNEIKDLQNYNGKLDKSTIFPQWYYRKDTINEIEDVYQEMSGSLTKNFSQLAGAEIVKYDNLDEYRIWNHTKAIDMRKEKRLRGNMMYEEDIWKVLINPLNIVQHNEEINDWKKKWNISNKTQDYQVPVEINYFNIYYNEDPEHNNSDELLNIENRNLYLPDDWERNIIHWTDYESLNKQVKMKDKFIKIRIRYSGEDLAIISAIKTIYRINNL